MKGNNDLVRLLYPPTSAFHLSYAVSQFMSTAVADLVSTISGTRPQAEPPDARLASELLGEAAR